MRKFIRRFLLLFILVVGISTAVIYTTVDINTLQNLNQFQPWSLAFALCAIALGMLIFGNYFLALLTPGATGGAVAQVMFLRHAGVPTGKAAVLVIVRTLLSIFFLALCMPLIFLHDEGIVPGISNDVLMVITLTAFVGIILIVVGARRGYLDYLVVRLARRLRDHRRRKLFAFYRDTKSAISLLLDAPHQMLVVFAESGLNLLCIYAVVPCLLLGLGVTNADWYTVMGRMIFLNMLLYFSPTPGGSGIAEGGFVLLFSSVVPAGTVGIVAVCWRLIAEYLPFLIGFYYTVTVFGREFLRRY